MRPLFALILRGRMRLAERIRLTETHRLLAWAVPAGVIGAAATYGFRWALSWVQQALYGTHADLAIVASQIPTGWRIAAPAIGGILAGFLLIWARRYRSRESPSEYMEAVAIGNGRIPVAETLVKSASSLVSIASGSSIGREGPMVQLAALAGSVLAGYRHIGVETRRLIVACGAAAGMTVAYNAPIASAVFVAGIVLGSLSMERVGPLIVAAVIANLLMRALPGYQPLYAVPAIPDIGGLQVAMLALVGVLAGLLAAPYLRWLALGKSFFEKLSLAPPIALGLGGLIVGLISWGAPQVWGNGYSVVNLLLAHPQASLAVLLLLAAKLAATAAATGSGAVGGIFTPTLFVGAAIGALAAQAAETWFPGAAVTPVAFVVVGMGAFLAATAQAPIMAILMVFEMTMSYATLTPMLLAAVLAYFTALAIGSPSMYSLTIRHREQEQALVRLHGLTVGDLTISATPQVLGADATMSEVQRKFLEIPVKFIYLVEPNGRWVGAVALSRINGLALDGAENALEQSPARQAIEPDFPVLYPEMRVAEALDAFVRHIGERLPVLDNAQDRRFIGVVSKVDLLTRMQDVL